VGRRREVHAGFFVPQVSREDQEEALITLLARIPERRTLNLSYEAIQELPVRLRDKMLARLQEWWAEEDSKRQRG
jgi:hypothetical protein